MGTWLEAAHAEVIAGLLKVTEQRQEQGVKSRSINGSSPWLGGSSMDWVRCYGVESTQNTHRFPWKRSEGRYRSVLQARVAHHSIGSVH